MSLKLNRALSFLLILMVVAAAWLSPVYGQDRSAEVRALLDARDREIKTLLGNRKTFTEQQRAQLKTVINGVIDFEGMGQSALGPHWAKLTPAQRSEFVNVFSEIVRAQSLADVDMYRTRVVYDRIIVKGDSAHVITSVTYKNVPAKVEYKMGLRQGKWRVRDIILDRVSTTSGYAKSFQAVVRKRGFEALMTSLRKRLDQLNKAKPA